LTPKPIMQLRLPWSAPRATDHRRVTLGGRPYEMRIVRHRRARRFVLRVGGDGVLKLTVPRGAAIADGLSFVGRQTAWVEREQARQLERAAPWKPGTELLFRGERATINVDRDVITFGGQIVPVDDDIAAAIKSHMVAIARRELPARCLELAARHRLTVSRVVIRNQRSRWGSCSTRGSIALNWRLIQMPPEIADYVVLHELMHLRQGNHSRRFWKEVEGVCPEWREAETWLRRYGREIL
jgi:predicted metal-dependent hydrolase